ncbi:MAG: hypothetical protein JXR91_07220 [Deltaproteobacteria bacterium]|nr:hypothetical protein [Deltaproteobacteria bacterium]
MTILKLTKIIALSLFFIFIYGCKEIAQNSSSDISNGVFVLTTDYQSGAYSIINSDDYTVKKSAGMIYQDALCRSFNISGVESDIFVVSRLGGDSIDIINLEDNRNIENEFSAGAGSNPQDIAVVSEKLAYVALLNRPYILAINPLTGKEITRIDLSEFADSDGLPEVSSVFYHDKKLYAAVERLNIANSFKPSDYSLLLIIDVKSNKVERNIKLSFTNPFGLLEYFEFYNSLVIVESGVFTSMNDSTSYDGGVELFNLETGELSGAIISENELGGDILDAVLLNDKKGYAIVGKKSDTGSKTDVVSFIPGISGVAGNAAAGKVIKTVLKSDSWSYNSVSLSPDGSQIWISDRSIYSPGIRIFNTDDDKEIQDSPIDTGLPPSMVCFSYSSDVDSDNNYFSTDSETVKETTSETDSESSDFPAELSVSMDSSQISGWADEVFDYKPGDSVDPPWNDPLNATGPAEGKTENVVSLGEGGAIDLIFNPSVKNTDGDDFAVFENSFSDNFLELAYVEVSTDGVNYIRFENFYLGKEPVSTYGESNPEDIQGLAGKYRRGLGTPFDLESLKNTSPVIEGIVDINNIKHIRIIDIIGDGTFFDSNGNPIYDPYPTTGSAGFDLDAIGVLN